MGRPQSTEPPRAVIRIQLRPEAIDELHRLAKAGGMTQIHISSTLVEWFASQPRSIQACILYSEDLEPDIVKLILANKKRQK